MMIGLCVASTGFVALSAQSETSQLEVVNTVDSNSRAAYDILVRPHGTQSDRERDKGLVQPGFLSSVHGGISIEQWEKIKKMQGVDVAAPVALIGSMVYKHRHYVGGDTDASDVTSLDVKYSYDRGLSVVAADRQFFLPSNTAKAQECLEVPVRTRVNSGQPVAVCGELESVRRQAQSVDFDFPFTIAAIDPEEEAKLSKLPDAVTIGEYLRPGKPDEVVAARDFDNANVATLPVLVSERPSVDMAADYQLFRHAPTKPVDEYSSVTDINVANKQLVAQGQVTVAEAYSALVDSLNTPETARDMSSRDFFGYVYSSLNTVYQAGALNYRGDSDQLVPAARDSSVSEWIGEGEYAKDKTYMPPGGDDTSFRPLHGVYGNYVNSSSRAPLIVKVGTYNPDVIKASSPLSTTSMGLYASMDVTARDEQSEGLLSGQALAASPNLRGYVQGPPLMVTTLDALRAATEPAWLPIADEKGMYASPSSVVDASQPLSAIRVRVAAVQGIDDESRARVNLVADQIVQQTGLQVDITLGVSPSAQDVDLPAGKYGRPDLALSEVFTKKGVVVAIKEAIDRKTLLLFVLVLAVAALLMVNLMLATVRARHAEVALRRCVGWEKHAVFRLFAGEAVMTSCAAGSVSVGLLLLFDVMGLADIPVARALLALPVAVAVAVPAAVIGGWNAVKIPPMDAFAGNVSDIRRSARCSMPSMALSGLLRTPGRSSLAMAGLGIGAVAVSVIAFALTQFRGAVVGSLLGEAVTIQVRGADIVACSGIVAMAVFGVLNVVYVNMRERGQEIATLRALGWTAWKVNALMLLESCFLGLAAAGGATVVVGVALPMMFDVSVMAFSAMMLTVAVGLVVVSLLATLVPLVAMSRANVSTLLAGE